MSKTKTYDVASEKFRSKLKNVPGGFCRSSYYVAFFLGVAQMPLHFSRPLK